MNYAKAPKPLQIAKPMQFEDVLSPAIQIPKLYAFQSYFDSALLQNAILSQPPNQPIIQSTIDESQLKGYAIGLHPSSQTPVAVKFRSGDRSAATVAYVLKPGQVVRPTGRPGAGSSAFNGFTYGLPFGWLGGGLANFYVFQTPDSDSAWPGNAEVVFHRMRVPVKQPADLTVGGGFNNAPLNWPMRFPWSQAKQGANAMPQQGQPVISITEPTRTILTLRGASTLAAAARMRIIYQATDDFGVNSDGTVNLANPVFEDVVWPNWASSGTSGNLATQNPFIVQGIGSGLTRLAADDGGIVFLDMSGTGALSGLFVDVERFGRL